MNAVKESRSVHNITWQAQPHTPATAAAAFLTVLVVLPAPPPTVAVADPPATSAVVNAADDLTAPADAAVGVPEATEGPTPTPRLAAAAAAAAAV